MNVTGTTVLLVEDDEHEARLLEDAFRGFKVCQRLEIVRDGQEAIDYLAGAGECGGRQFHPLPRLVLLDLHLPRKDGFEVLEWMRAGSPFRRLPVIVLSCSVDPADVERAYSSGANSYLVKPGDRAALHRLVETIGLYWILLNTLPRTGDPRVP